MQSSESRKWVSFPLAEMNRISKTDETKQPIAAFRPLWIRPGPPLPSQFEFIDDWDQAFENPGGSQLLPRDTGIFGLPPELLGVIFLFAQSDTSAWTSDGRGWIIITHVSRYWRQVALNLPQLWASIDTSWRIVAPVYFRRSGSAPLNMKINLRRRLSWRECHVINIALTQLSRTRQLHLNVEGLNELVKISSSQGRPDCTLSLHSLIIQSSIPLALPPNIFAQTFACLESLETSNVFMPFPPGLLCNIKILKVYWVGHWRDGLTNWLSFVSTMENCTNLEQLDFHNKFVPFKVDITPLTKTIFLPRLRHLTLTDRSSVTALHLINQLTLPVLTSLFMSGSAEVSSNYPPIPYVFASAFDSCLVSMNEKCVHTQLSSKVDHELTMGVELGLRPDRQRHLEDCFLVFRSVIRAVLPRLNSLFITLDFRLTFIQPMTRMDWVVFFATVPNLLELTFTDHNDRSAGTLLEALSLKHPWTRMYCPKLQAVTFKNISFEPPLYDRSSFIRSICPPPKAEERLKLAKLDISECDGIGYVPPEKLIPFVGDVLWDPLRCKPPAYC
ncbi:hypothetical protein BD410DRAFT_794992 [Rickenella mellea]|uniref:Uncharacterized protein n=1 Tax=Rickenella mellea TaxID=50990 RepID=A0A4Y7PP35_9AGAM|nr:hypothetical protein BD410DRAFT_794992 [Rickenella mellea]